MAPIETGDRFSFTVEMMCAADSNMATSACTVSRESVEVADDLDEVVVVVVVDVDVDDNMDSCSCMHCCHWKFANDIAVAGIASAMGTMSVFERSPRFSAWNEMYVSSSSSKSNMRKKRNSGGQMPSPVVSNFHFTNAHAMLPNRVSHVGM